jgi:hypothetical protein
MYKPNVTTSGSHATNLLPGKPREEGSAKENAIRNLGLLKAVRFVITALPAPQDRPPKLLSVTPMPSNMSDPKI